MSKQWQEYERRVEAFLDQNSVEVHRTAPMGYEGTDILTKGDTRPRLILDCKYQQSLKLGIWIDQVENDVTKWQEFSGEPEPRIPMVVHRRRNHSMRSDEGIAAQWVTMTLDSLVRLITQAREQGVPAP